MADYLVQEDGTSKLTLEDASGAILLEIQTSIAPDFIASATAMYAPTMNVTQPMPFITAGRIDVFPISEDFLGNTAEYEQGGGQGYDDFTLASEKSAPAVYPPELPEVQVDFIASRTVVYTADVPEVHADFIPSLTALHVPTLALSGEVTINTAATYLWLCPPDITQVAVECFGGGGAGGHGDGTHGGGGGGGGAFARGNTIPVTPGSLYTLVVGGQASDSSFTGDSGNQVVAKGGTNAGAPPAQGTGGSAASSTGDIKFSGGDGGLGAFAAGNKTGGGGGASGNIVATGNSGTDGSSASPGSGGIGANGGGSGGAGGNQGSDNATAGTVPGGGGGGGGGVTGGEPGKAGANGQVYISLGVHPSFIGSATVVYTPLLPEIFAPFISSNTLAYAPMLTSPSVTAPFVPSVTIIYTPIVQGPEIDPDFIDSATLVYLPTLERTFTGTAVSQISLEVTVALPAGTARTSQLVLEVLKPVPIGLHVWQKV